MDQTTQPNPHPENFEQWLENPVTKWVQSRIRTLIAEEQQSILNEECFDQENPNVTQSLTAKSLGRTSAFADVLMIGVLEEIDEREDFDE